MPVLSDRVGTFTDSVIRRMTRRQRQPMPARTSTL